jgi:protein FAM50
MNFAAGYVGSAGDGLKIRRLEEERKKQNEQAERVKAELAAESSKSRIVNFSAGNSEVIENAFKQESVGLQTKEQFVEKRANIERELEEERAKTEKAAAAADAKQKEKKRKKQKKELGAKLSFGDDEEFQDEDAEDEFVPAKKVGKVGKNPEVKTHFLPDRDREVAERDERERLKAQFLAEQDAIKKEKLQITFSYWDGGGHRRKVECLKGDYHRAVPGQGEGHAEQRVSRAAALVDRRAHVHKGGPHPPHTATFYDFIVNKSRGKSGPLFHFDVHDDVRLRGGSNVEKEDSHAGKVVHRSWFEKNKHIFPASRWEPYDPLKEHGGYNVYAGEKD